jgi:hypothetical protein
MTSRSVKVPCALAETVNSATTVKKEIAIVAQYRFAIPAFFRSLI